MDNLTLSSAQKLRTMLCAKFPESNWNIVASENNFDNTFTVNIGTLFTPCKITFVKVKNHSIFGDYWVATAPCTNEMCEIILEGKNVNKDKGYCYGTNPIEYDVKVFYDRICDEINNKLKGVVPFGYKCGAMATSMFEYAITGGHLGSKYKYIVTDNYQELKTGNHLNSLGITVLYNDPVWTLDYPYLEDHSIKNMFDDAFKIGELDFEAFMSEEDCQYMFASMAACMLNKFLGNKLQSFEQKISGKITEAGSKLNSAIASELTDVNSLSSYLEREKFMMEKAAKQINGIDNLL
jgi:hypothetical protein